MADVGGGPTGALETVERSLAERLGEERAMQILERAAALDAKRSSEFEVDQLREAAAAAGISAEAFDQAMRELSGGRPVPTEGPGAHLPTRTPGASEIARFGGLLRDLLGDDTQVVVVDDRIEGRSEDGIVVSIGAASGEATAALGASGSLRGRIMTLGLSATLPGFFAFILAMEEADAGIGMMVGVTATAVSAGVGSVISHFREKKALQKKVDRIRRQLQRMMDRGSEDR